MRLLELASHKFEKAVQSFPNNSLTLYRWGRVLVIQAQMLKGKEKAQARFQLLSRYIFPFIYF